MFKSCLLALCFLAVASVPAQQTSREEYELKQGDRVVFYGDSITDYGAYPYLIELFTATRYPSLDVAFSNAGVGGETVSGGGLGSVDQRLTRDVFARRPTVVTCMLGMNDGQYRPFDEGIFENFRRGYGHIADRLKQEAPGARVWLLRPTPYDDLTKAPAFFGGYNGVLVRYGDAVSELAKSRGYGLADLNSPLVSLLKWSIAENPQLANNLIPDRIHPIPQTHLAMAAEILKGWRASPTVSSTILDWQTGKATMQNAELSSWRSGSFTLREKALPMPLDRKEAFAALVIRGIDFDATLNREFLQVNGMPKGRYCLHIDGTAVGEFSDEDFGKGFNLAVFDTPMVRQARKVAEMTQRLVSLRSTRWRAIEIPMVNAPKKERDGVVQSMLRLEAAIARERFRAARPIPHRFEILPLVQAGANFVKKPIEQPGRSAI